MTAHDTADTGMLSHTTHQAEPWAATYLLLVDQSDSLTLPRCGTDNGWHLDSLVDAVSSGEGHSSSGDYREWVGGAAQRVLVFGWTACY